MKKQFSNILPIFLFFISTNLFAQQQDITGVWKGLLYVDSTKAFLPYEIAVSEEKNKMIGYSRIIFFENGKEESGFEELDIKWKGSQVIVEDRGFFEQNFTKKVVKRIKKTLVLALIISDTEMVLTGKWSTNRTRFYLAATGTVELKRKPDFKTTALYQHLDTLKLAQKLIFTFAEKKTVPVLIAAKNSEIKTGEPDAEEDQAILPKLVKLQNLQLLPVTKNRQPAIAKIEPSKREKKLLYASLTKTAINYKPTIVPAPVVTTEPITTVAVNPKPIIKKSGPVTTVAVNPKPIVKKAEPEVVIKETPAEVLKPAVKPVQRIEPPALAWIAPSYSDGAVDLSKRITKSDRSFYFESDSLVLTLYDNGEVDGDTVTVLMNGGVIFSKQGLTTKANAKTIYISNTLDSVNLVMYAENLGEIPPNTGLLVVTDGEKRYDVRFSADLNTNAAIILRRKKN